MTGKKLISILACPVCNGNLKPDKDRLICLNCKCSYPVREGIPVLLAEEAEIEKNKKI